MQVWPSHITNACSRTRQNRAAELGRQASNEFKGSWTVNDKKEAVWFAVVSVIALLILVILHQSGEIIGARAGLEEVSVPVVYWVVVVSCLGLCALVPYLLRESTPLDFKIIAILLTALAPAILVAFVLFSLWRSASPR